jgi:predicted nucleotidyltransferase component of viral defense system
MQQTHLTAWQARAPWPKRSQIEQDLRLSRGVAAIFKDETLSKHLAMRGGTVLHKAHLAPASRYSEDIDLVLTKSMPSDALERHLVRVLTPALGKPSPSMLADAWLAVRNVVRPSKILRIVFEFTPVGLARPEKVKIEVNLNEEQALYPLVEVDLETLSEDGDVEVAKVRSYDINEMLGTKTRALMQRKQGRDLFDLWHAWTLSEAGTTGKAKPTACSMSV